MPRGLTGSYYLNPGWAGAPNLTTREQTISLARMQLEYPAFAANYSMLWTGAIFIPAGAYRFTTLSDDGSELWLDGRLVVDNGGAHGLTARTGAINLARGFHAMRIRYFQGTGGATLKVDWTPPGQKSEALAHALRRLYETLSEIIFRFVLRDNVYYYSNTSDSFDVVAGMSLRNSRNLDTPPVSGISKTHSRNNRVLCVTLRFSVPAYCYWPCLRPFSASGWSIFWPTRPKT